MKTIPQRLQAKADAVAKRNRNDLDYISVYTDNDCESDTFGFIFVEFAEWGGPKMKDGKIVGDHDHIGSLNELDRFVRILGGFLSYHSDGSDIDHHALYTYRVCWDELANKVVGYEVVKDITDEGKIVYDVYEDYRDGRGCCDESFPNKEDATNYIRKEFNWKGKINYYE